MSPLATLKPEGGFKVAWVRGFPLSPPQQPKNNSMQSISKSSINVKVIKTHSESHNLRKDELNYTFKDLEKNNESWIAESTSDRLKAIKEYCKEKSGRKLQTNAEPIREAVVNLKPDTTMEDVKKMCERLKNELKMEAFQIHIHRDEGKSRDNLNYHAHVVFDYQDKEKGTVLRLSKGDLYKMQDIVAESLGMERGKTSNKEHLSALEYKNKMEEEKFAILSAKNEEISKTYESIRDKINNSAESIESLKKEQQKELEKLERLKSQNNNLESAAKSLLVTNFIGMVDKEKTIENIAQLQASNEVNKSNIERISTDLRRIEQHRDDLARDNNKFRADNLQLQKYKELSAKALLLPKFNKSFKEEYIQKLREDKDFNKYYEKAEKAFQQPSEQKQQQKNNQRDKGNEM